MNVITRHNRIYGLFFIVCIGVFLVCVCVCVVFWGVFLGWGGVVVVVFFSFFVGVGGWGGVSFYGFKEACC